MSDLFSLFGLPFGFDLALDLLEERYEQAQRKVHPDQWGSWLFKQSGQALSAQLTKAYGLLKDPIERGAYCLQQMGAWPIPVFEDVVSEAFALQERTCSAKEKEQIYRQAYEKVREAFIQVPLDREGLQRAYSRFLFLSRWKKA